MPPARTKLTISKFIDSSMTSAWKIVSSYFASATIWRARYSNSGLGSDWGTCPTLSVDGLSGAATYLAGLSAYVMALLALACATYRSINRCIPPYFGKDDDRDHCNTEESGDGDRMFGKDGCNLQCHPRPFSSCLASAPNGTAGSYDLSLLKIVRTNPLTGRIVYASVSRYRAVTHQG